MILAVIWLVALLLCFALAIWEAWPRARPVHWRPFRLESVTITHPELAELWGVPEVVQGSRSWATLEDYEQEMGALW